MVQTIESFVSKADFNYSYIARALYLKREGHSLPKIRKAAIILSL